MNARTKTEPAMTKAEIEALLKAGFSDWPKAGLYLEDIKYRAVRVRKSIHDHELRPGGTVSGPTMFLVADTSFYVAVLASVGPEALAVTTNVSINFLRKPSPRDLIADCRLFKLGKRLAVGEVTIFSEGEDEPVAHATGTYSIPPVQ
ncbi:MAG: hypothetical protein DHS20C05_08190 [Hyphococcus sp.]|nr:MAG: hypothetical protein DHS20C05_08190 [Marinicaulis sp.]